jgi:hypothetical protein
MPQSRAELKARMMREVEALVDQLLAEKRPAHEITLSEIERAALAAGSRFEGLVVKEWVADSQGDTSSIPKCPSCGHPMELKGHRQRWVVTQAGEVALRRPYYYCADCRRGLFPPR